MEKASNTQNIFLFMTCSGGWFHNGQVEVDWGKWIDRLLSRPLEIGDLRQ